MENQHKNTVKQIIKERCKAMNGSTDTTADIKYNIDNNINGDNTINKFLEILFFNKIIDNVNDINSKISPTKFNILLSNILKIDKNTHIYIKTQKNIFKL